MKNTSNVSYKKVPFLTKIDGIKNWPVPAKQVGILMFIIETFIIFENIERKIL